VKNKCNSLGCTPTEYFRTLINKDLKLEINDDITVNDNEIVVVVSNQSPIPHNSHPRITLIGFTEQNGKTFYFDDRETITHKARQNANSNHTRKNCKNHLDNINICNHE
jgi:hypothetical protein